jgi:uridine kinase
MSPTQHASEHAIEQKYRCRKKAEIPIYSFARHQREPETTSIYSPHVLILEGIFALYDPRVLELLDMKVCTLQNIVFDIFIC